MTATAESPTSGKVAFDHVAGLGSLGFLACKQVLDRANLWYSNVWSLRVRIVYYGAFAFSGGRGDGGLDWKRRVTEGSELGDSHFRLNSFELVLRSFHNDSSAVENAKSRVAQRTTHGCMVRQWPKPWQNMIRFLYSHNTEGYVCHTDIWYQCICGIVYPHSFQKFSCKT